MPESSNHELSNSKLKFGIWLATNKILIKKIIVIFLFFLNIILFGYATYETIFILIIQKDEYNALMSDLSKDYINYSYWREVQKPKDIQLSSPAILTTANSRSDVVASVYNPNDNFVVTSLKYQVTVGEKIVRQGESFIWPGERKYLIELGIEGGSGNILFDVTGVGWMRVSDFKSQLNKYSRFNIDQVSYSLGSGSAGTGNIKQTQVAFRLKNENVRDYWEVGLVVIVLDGSQVVGANYAKVERLMSQETRNVTVAWPEPISRITNVEILPEVNILDQNIYMDSDNDPGELK